nr:hypothetical protein [Xanthomonadaceae bacterium]
MDSEVAMRKLLAFALLALAAGAQAAAVAGEGFPPEKGLDVATPFEVQRTAILQALQEGRVYAEITPDNRRRVLASLDRMVELLAGRPVAELSEADRIEVFNHQELVNTLLAGAREDSRLVCRRETRVGSHRPTNRCMTVAERRRAREESQVALDEIQRAATRAREPN